MESRPGAVRLVAMLLLLSGLALPGESQLSSGFYQGSCPRAQSVISSIVQRTVKRDPRMGASLLRLHFHDCFVNGCDGSILLDGNDGEKMALPNQGTARGFEVIDEIKQAVDRECGRNDLVSCADILTLATRDSIVALGGPWYDVPLGRRDSTPRQSSKNDADEAIPGPTFDFQRIVSKFNAQGMSVGDLVVLSSAHTLGFTKCKFTRKDQLDWLRQQCPMDDAVVALDQSPNTFDNGYFQNLLQGRGVLPSDQILFRGDGGETDRLIQLYSSDWEAHRRDFAQAMIKMGNIRPLTGNQGEIRRNCRLPNGQTPTWQGRPTPTWQRRPTPYY